MNLNNLRRQLRRSIKTRRVDDRRKAPYPYGSPEWIENIKENYLALPKENRRVRNRREDDRRKADRRQPHVSEQTHSAKKFSKVLLSREERALIEDLFFNDRD